MAHLSDWPEKQRNKLIDQELPSYNATSCKKGPPLSKRKIALISTAGIHRRQDDVFTPGVGEYRVIPKNVDMADLIMSHVSTNFDRTGFQQDLNVIFPIERLKELKKLKKIGSVASFHYSFMGATPPAAHESVSNDLANSLRGDNVDGVILAGV